MEVVLLESLPNIGQKGDLKNVRPGFFRNFLLPYGKAVLATETVKGQWAKRREKMLLEKEVLKTKAKEFVQRLAEKVFVVKKKATKKGTLYSAVTAHGIAEIVKAEANVELAPEMIKLEAPIKTLGTHEIPVRVDEGVEVKISLEIQAA